MDKCLVIHNSAHKKQSNPSGFTFIELIISMTIFLIGVVGIMSLLPVGIRASVRAVNITKAAFLAQMVMEEIKRDGYASLLPSPGERPETDSVDYPDFRYSVDWADVSGETNLISVTVSVSWQEANTTRTKDFVTYITT